METWRKKAFSPDPLKMVLSTREGGSWDGMSMFSWSKREVPSAEDQRHYVENLRHLIVDTGPARWEVLYERLEPCLNRFCNLRSFQSVKSAWLLADNHPGFQWLGYGKVGKQSKRS